MTALEDHARSIFLAALERAPDEWPAFVEEACGGSADLRARVEQLLHAHQAMGSIHGGGARTPTATIDEAITERPGTVIGPYKLMEQIGEGGMGLVFVAEQQHPIRRRVALKVIKPGMDTRQVVARFEAERQALALMDHPHIAKVHDGGMTPSGRPYFVMELVKGVPITQFCDDHRLNTRERLELFLDVCQAVQHAHHKGIIHRDIKPTNVMVVSHDGKPVVKVIDFGVAKSIGQQLTDKTVYTQFVQLVGTPLYMSPEQAGESGLDVDTRSDIYSLGVLLYQLLTGTTPFESERLKEASYEEIRRIIREEEPPKPSTRISTLGKAATTVSTQRKSDPIRLRQLIRGELDWIVMKCLEKDRNRRYETANAFAIDVQRYLHDEPVLACPPSAGYRLRKFARKYRTLLRVAALFVVLLTLAAVVSTWQAVRATRERDRAEASFRMARDAVDRLFIQVSDSPKLKTKSMEKFRRELLQNAKEFYERFIREQFDTPGVRYDLGLAYQRLVQINRELGDFAAAEESSSKATALLSALATAQPDVPEYQRELAANYFALGLVYFDTARWEQAEGAFEQALAIQQKQADACPNEAAYRFALAKTYRASGFLHGRLDQPDMAAKRYHQALDVLTMLVQDYPLPEHESLLATTQVNLANVYCTKGWYDKAEPILKEAQRIYRRLLHDESDALPEYRQSLAQSYFTLAMAYRDQAKTEEAEAAGQQAVEIYEKLTKEHPDVLDYAYGVGRCYVDWGITASRAGRPDAGVARCDQAIAILEGVVDGGLGAARNQLLNARIARTLCLATGGDHAQATAEAEALARQEELLSILLYDICCVFSRASAAVDRDDRLSPADRARLKARYADRAMDFLRQAVAKGWRHPEAIKRDPDIQVLRARGDFHKLLAELEAEEKK
jgi:eukaryotic-like serine/threonine-protein kinase